MLNEPTVEALSVAEVKSLNLPLVKFVHQDHLGNHDARLIVEAGLAVIAFQVDGHAIWWRQVSWLRRLPS